MINVRSLALSERARLLADKSSSSWIRPEDENEQSRDSRLEWWAQSYFSGDAEKISEWLRLVTSSDDSAQLVERDGFIPLDQLGDIAWAQAFRQGMSLLEEASEESKLALQADLGFLTSLAPQLLWCSDQCSRAVSELASDTPFANSDIIERAFYQYIKVRLSAIASKSAALALNIARIGGDLVGETADERHTSFSRLLTDPIRRPHFLRHCPALDRVLFEVCVGAVASLRLFVGRVSNDWGELERYTGFAELTPSAVRFGLGDPHVHGKTVIHVEFEQTSIIYKPHSMMSDNAVADFIQFLAAGLEDAPEPLHALDRGDYGWVRFVRHAECKSIADVHTCYRRLGALLSVLYTVGASDVHYENIIFHGPYPYLVDVETILLPLLTTAGGRRSDQVILHQTINSVLSIGYLPAPSIVAGRKLDLSAASAIKPQEAVSTGHRLNWSDRDAPRLQPVKMDFFPEGNVVSCDGIIKPANEYVDDIVAGFTDGFLRIRNTRSELLKSGGIIGQFRDCVTRVVLRSTMTYASILRSSYHPGFLRDHADFEAAHSGLIGHANDFDQANRDLPMRHVFASELGDLKRGDIPYFSARGDSDVVFTADGVAVEGVIERSGFDQMMARLCALTDADLAREISLIRVSLATMAMSGGPGKQPGETVERARSHVKPDEYVARAERIASELMESAGRYEGVPTWFAPQLIGEADYAPQLVGPSLYEGYPAIGMFFAELFNVTGREEYRDWAESCRKGIRLEDAVSVFSCVGAFEGITGLIFAELSISERIGGLDVASCERWLNEASRLVATDDKFDIIAGSAGALLVALNTFRIPDLRARSSELAAQCFDRIAQSAQVQHEVASWANPLFGNTLSGFSHGSMGIGFALAAYATEFSHDASFELALKAIRHSFESRMAGGLAEERPGTWCHGSPGLALALDHLCGLPAFREISWIRDFRDQQLANTVNGGEGGSHCLCHGAFGNAATLIAAGEPWADYGRGIIERACQMAERSGNYRGGLASYYPHPGLMTGQAGVGLGLIAASRSQAPSVLLLSIGMGGDMQPITPRRGRLRRRERA